jgi:hypothetical protein
VEQYALAHQREHEALNAKLDDVGAKLDSLIETIEEEIKDYDNEVEEGDNMAKTKIDDDMEEKAFVGDVGGDTTTPDLYSKTKQLPSKQEERYEEEETAGEMPEELKKKLNEMDEQEEQARKTLATIATAKKKLLATKAAKCATCDEDECECDAEEEAAKKMYWTAVSKLKTIAAKKKANVKAADDEKKDDEKKDEKSADISLKVIDIPKPSDAGPSIEKPKVSAEAESEEDDMEDEVETAKKNRASAGGHVQDFKVTAPEQYQKTVTLRSGSANATKDVEKAELMKRVEKLEMQRKFELATAVSKITGKSAREVASKPLSEVEAIYDAVKDIRPMNETATSRVPEFADADVGGTETADERIKRLGVAGALAYAWEEGTKRTRGQSITL